MKLSDIEVGGRYQTKNNGDLVVLRKLKKKNYYLVEFIDTGYQKEMRADGIRSGIAKDWLRPSRFGVGYIGLGTYSTVNIEGNANHCSIIWKSMLERCYCPNFQIKSPTYKGCIVVDEWHNYQIFAKWYYENYPVDGNIYQLDKDSIIKGNKLYSPDTCAFLTKYDNIRISQEKNYKFVNPDGELIEITNITEYCRDKNLTRENMGKVHRGERRHHKGWTKYEE